MNDEEKLKIYRGFLFKKINILENAFRDIKELLSRKRMSRKFDWKKDLTQDFWTYVGIIELKSNYFIEAYLNNLYSLLNILAIYIKYYSHYINKDDEKITFHDLIKNDSKIDWVNKFANDVENKNWYKNFKKYRNASTHRVCVIVKTDTHIINDEDLQFKAYFPKDPKDFNCFIDRKFDEKPENLIEALPVIAEIYENVMEFLNKNKVNLENLSSLR